MKRCLKISILIWMISILLTGCSGMSGQETIGAVTIEIRCDTAVANGLHLEEKWQGIIPEDGCILSETEIEIVKGDTVFDVLLKVRDEYKIHMEYSGGASTEYIEGIGNLYEYDGGRWSGWMFSVNGEHPEVGCGQCELKDGDAVRWDYTCDLGLDLDAGMEGAQEWKETHE